jgi:hypothetical protein
VNPAPLDDPARAAVLREIFVGTFWERLHTSEVAR